MAASFTARLKEILRTNAPDFLFVEPSGMVVTKELRDVAVMALRDVSYDIGALITLVDGPMFESWWDDRKQLLLGQVTGADLVAISRADLLKPQHLEQIQVSLGSYANGMMTLSTHHGWGVGEVVAQIG